MMSDERKAGVILTATGAIIDLVVLAGHTNLRISRDAGLTIGTLTLGGGLLLLATSRAS